MRSSTGLPGRVVWEGFPRKRRATRPGVRIPSPGEREAQLRRTSPIRILEKGWPRLALLLVCLLVLAVPLTAGADDEAEATVSPGLLDAARAAPNSDFSVIVQGEAAEAVAAEVESTVEEEGSPEAAATAVEESFVTVPGVSATLTGDEVVALASSPEPLVISLDAPTTAADLPTTTSLPTIQGTAVAGTELSVDARRLEWHAAAFLRVPVAALRDVWPGLPEHRRRDSRRLHARCGRRRVDPARARRGNGKRGLGDGHVGTDSRRRCSRRARERPVEHGGAAGVRSRGARTGPHDDARRMGGWWRSLLLVPVAALRQGGSRGRRRRGPADRLLAVLGATAAKWRPTRPATA